MARIIFQTGKELVISVNNIDPMELFGKTEPLITLKTEKGNTVTFCQKDVLCLIENPEHHTETPEMIDEIAEKVVKKLNDGMSL